MQYGDVRTSNRAEALALSEKAIALDPFDSGGYSMLGFTVAYEGDLKKALEHFEMATQLNPNDSYSLFLNSDVLVLAGHPQRALQTIIEAIRLNPRAPGHYYWILG